MTAAPAEVVVVTGDRIVATGAADLVAAYPDAEVHDLAGRSLTPGFIDAHNHLCIAALRPCWADLAEVTTTEDLLAAVTAQAAREPETPWVRAGSWYDHETRVWPHRRDLDALGIDRPVVVAHYSLHMCVVDSRGLDELGIGRDTPDPPGGEIRRDPDGEPDGTLIERAWSRAHAASLAPFTDPDRWPEHIVVRARTLLADGITCVHDAACPPAAEEAYAALAAAGELPLSVVALPHPDAILGHPDAGRLDGPPTGEGDEWFRVGAVKLFADGGVAPAIDVHANGHRFRTGTLMPELSEQVGQVVDRGFRVAVHAMGNEGLQATIDAFAAAARAHPGHDQRFRVEHATLASPDQFAELAALGAVAVVQPGFVAHIGEAIQGVRFDDATWLPFRDIAEAGVAMAASSDDPCTFHEPLQTSSYGATRLTSSGAALADGQGVAYDDWLRAYTVGAAYAGGQEDERGQLRPGLRADLVVLDGELDAEHPPSVAQTWVAGELVYTA